MSATLLPGPVVVNNDTTGPGPSIPGCGVTGGGSQWSDGDNGSYATIGADATLSNDMAYADLSQFTGDPSVVVDILLNTTVEVLPDGVTIEATLNVDLPSVTTTLGLTLAGSVPFLPLDTTTHTYSRSFMALLLDAVSFGQALTYIQEIATFLAAGTQTARVSISGTYAQGHTLIANVYELSIVLVYPVETADIGNSRQSFLRGR